MERRLFLQLLIGLAAWPLRRAWAEGGESASSGGSGPIRRLDVDPEAWRSRLSDDAYRVLFEGETEPPFSSPLDAEERAGTYVCAACKLPLFRSAAKFDSGTGWPSFTRPIAGHVETELDFHWLLPRTEYHCIRCGGHQGHRFDDGPPPTGERWCNNGLALAFVLEGEPLPDRVVP
ncbi:MAG: peptide-methionine (R)-S-oxide reductase MsrB [Myxococcota bacterium]